MCVFIQNHSGNMWNDSKKKDNFHYYESYVKDNIEIDCQLKCFNLLLQAEVSNKRHRPIGIGVQGLADAMILMRYPFDSEEAQTLNKQIFETIYYGALKMSVQLAKEEGAYETYEGSPVSKGVSR